MSNLQIIEALCSLVEQQSRLIRQLSFALDEIRGLTDEEKNLAKKAQDAYSAILGAGEAPDNLYE